MKKLIQLSRGGYVADFRYDEGLRIRDEFVSPCLKSTLNGKDISTSILLIIVDETEGTEERNICG